LSRTDNLRLLDIIDASSEVAAIVSDGHDAYLASAVSKRAIERLLEIIGEAANLLSDETRSSFPDVEWRDITNLRILLAHHYFRVDEEQTWVIASVSVPDLASKLQS